MYYSKFLFCRYKDGKELVSAGRLTVDTDEEHQVSSINVEKLEEGDCGTVGTN